MRVGETLDGWQRNFNGGFSRVFFFNFFLLDVWCNCGLDSESVRLFLPCLPFFVRGKGSFLIMENHCG